MILVDASVLIDFLQTKDPKLDGLFRSLPMAVCGATRAEVLAGARNGMDRQRLLLFLNQFQQISAPDSCWDQLGDNLAAMYARGITVPFPDAVVATLGISNDIDVWSRDPHFAMMQKALPALKLDQEPPGVTAAPL